MEEISIKIKTAIEAAEAAKSVGALRKSLKDLKSLALETQGTNEKAFKSIASAIGNTTDKLEDLKDEFVAFKGSALEKFNATLQITKEGFANLDLDKIGTGFKNLGNIIKENPLLILATAVMAIVDNFKALTEAGGFIGDLFTGIGQAVDYVIKKFFEFTDALGITDSKAKEAAENAKKHSEDMAKAYETAATRAIKANEDWLSATEKRYNKEIELAQAAGKSTEEIEKRKNQAILNGLNKQISDLEDTKKFQGKLTEDEKASYQKLTEDKIELLKKIEVARVTSLTKQKNDANKAAAEEKAARQKEFIDQHNWEQGIIDGWEAEAKEKKLIKDAEEKKLRDAAIAKAAAEEERRISNEKAAQQATIDSSIQIANQLLDIERNKNNQILALELKRSQDNYSIAQATIEKQIIQQELSQEQANEVRNSLAKKQADTERKLKQEAFNKQKKIDIAQTIMNGTVAAARTYAQFGYPVGIVPALAMAATTAVQVAMINKQTPAFAEGGLVRGAGTTTSDSINARLSNGESVINAQSTAMFGDLLSAINQVGGGKSFKEPNRVTTSGSMEGNDGGGKSVRAYVVETDITESQNKIKRIQRRASYN